MNFYDAHNHLQDVRLNSVREEACRLLQEGGLVKQVVNGTRESDWELVLDFSEKYSHVLPSFGMHPWFLDQRTSNWKEEFLRYLDLVPSAMGEIGLDRWIEGHDIVLQEEIFCEQLEVAVERNLPVTIHCLKAWGHLEKLLRSSEVPSKGFLLHSYAGPVEMIPSFVKLGAYFSFSGYFIQSRKLKQQEALKSIPRDRLLIETDAPDMLLPEDWNEYLFKDMKTGEALNHPANIFSIYRFVAEYLGCSMKEFVSQVEGNFLRLFG